MTSHPDHHATALMLLRAARPGDPEEDLQFHLRATLKHLYCRWTTAEILAMAAAVDAREKAMREALEKARWGLKTAARGDCSHAEELCRIINAALTGTPS